MFTSVVHDKQLTIKEDVRHSSCRVQSSKEHETRHSVASHFVHCCRSRVETRRWSLQQRQPSRFAQRVETATCIFGFIKVKASFPQMLRTCFLKSNCLIRLWNAVLMVASERGPAEPRSTDSKEPATKRSRSKVCDPSSTSKELCAKTAPVAPTPRRCRRSDGPRSFMVHRIETGRECACGCRQRNGQHQVGGQWDGLGTEPYLGDDEHRKWETFFGPSSLISTIPSRCMSETVNWHVDSETGSFVSMGSGCRDLRLEQPADPLGGSSKMFGIGRRTRIQRPVKWATSTSWTADRSPSLPWK